MSKHMTFARPRGLMGHARADATPTELFAELRTSFKAMQDAMGEKDQKDVLTNEKIDRINATVGSLQKALDDANAAIAAAQIGAGGGDAPNPHAGEHAKAFNRFFKRGVTDGLAELEVKAELSTLSDPDGGYFVPKEVSTALEQVARTSITMRRLANVMTIGAMEYTKFVNLGGAGAGWVGEKEARAETTGPTAAEMAYTMMEVYAQPKTTQRLLDMAIIDIGAWLADEVDITFAQKENDAFINGDGVKKPRGFLTYDKVANASWAWGKIGYVPSGAAGAFLTPTTSVSPEDAFYDLVYAMKEMYRAGGSFLMADTTQGAVRKLKDVEGKNLWAPPTTPEGVPTIVGKPVYTDDYMPAIAANSYSIAFADWKKAYTVVERPGVQVIRDAITEKGFVKFYTRKYVGGGLGHYEPIKLMKFAVS